MFLGARSVSINP